jgi:hypothetical protein
MNIFDILIHDITNIKSPKLWSKMVVKDECKKRVRRRVTNAHARANTKRLNVI